MSVESIVGAGVVGSILNQQEKKRERKRATKKRKIAAQLAADAARKRTATRTDQRSAAANRNRAAGAVRPTGFAPPILGSSGQLGR